MTRFCSIAHIGLVLGMLAAIGHHAQAQAMDKAITLELNGLQPSDQGCRISFVVTSSLDRDVSRIAYEMVLFDKAGLVERMTVLALKDAPAGKTRVRQFDLAQADCANISRVLVNDATACEGDGLQADDCMTLLRTSTKSVPFSG